MQPTQRIYRPMCHVQITVSKSNNPRRQTLKQSVDCCAGFGYGLREMLKTRLKHHNNKPMGNTMLIEDLVKMKEQSPQQAQGDLSLSHCVRNAVSNYLKSLGDKKPENLYKEVIRQMEIPLFESVLEYTGGIELRATKILGIARGTLRTSLKKYNIDKRDFKRRKYMREEDYAREREEARERS